ncbi:MAG: helix-turn-helix domain-containing protein [Corynebacterium sp.]|uniref:helix-turn-helix domain-containing protein n=1 Tax=Corynebacterium sp. TaxID=1720 RepID=UPI003F90AC62
MHPRSRPGQTGPSPRLHRPCPWDCQEQCRAVPAEILHPRRRRWHARHHFEEVLQSADQTRRRAGLPPDGTATDDDRRHGVTTASQIYEWTKIYRGHGPGGLAPKQRDRRSKAEVTDTANMTEVQ